jgi:hypothetical protein
MPLVLENWSADRNSSPDAVLACTQAWEECHGEDGQSIDQGPISIIVVTRPSLVRPRRLLAACDKGVGEGDKWEIFGR